MGLHQIIKNCGIGKNTRIWNFVNLYRCKIGNNCQIGSFVEIQNNVVIGNNVKIQSYAFICEGVTIEDEAFIGHHVVFINDKFPKSANYAGRLKTKKDWKLLKTVVKKCASIGSNATILGGVTIGKGSFIGAGSVVTRDVPEYAIVAGNPARILRNAT